MRYEVTYLTRKNKKETCIINARNEGEAAYIAGLMQEVKLIWDVNKVDDEVTE